MADKPEISKEQMAKNEAAIIKWVSEQVAMDKQLLLKKFPFTGNFIMRLDCKVGYWEDLETAATDFRKIYINALFYAKCSAEERLFILAHECWHVIYRHLIRKCNRNHKLWNIATDLEIHFLLSDAGLKAPFVLPHDPAWKGLSAEEIYGKFIDKAKASKGAKTDKEGEGDGEGVITITEDELGEGDKLSDFPNGGQESKNLKSRNGEGFDQHRRPKAEDANEEDVDNAELDSEIRDKINATAKAVERMRGTLPAGIKRLVEDAKTPELSWKQLLQQYVTQCYQDQRRWTPPNRRYVYQDIYVQSNSGEQIRCFVGIDTSGSTTDDLPKFFGELSGLLTSFGNYEITTIQCDTQVNKIEKFSDENPYVPGKKWEGSGFGGTYLTPIFNWIKENAFEAPDVCIIFTDGYIEDDIKEAKPDYPVLWIICKNGMEDFNPGFGTVIHLKDD